ncbi:hypothetical protein FA10DRAFT_269334 [Acaromyces ingoldii]|uniref:BZIP domain-containing protein n=1 Tax=Acaromyces ingoldii TaxID=215250 RepID=A0A316YDS8_9BASI|nr:hypothetical protein FA10DRAFT_269334 [Acaromyces ingoldii]PWN87379.1 hypothetical protein FA10DRAFT_269334 [Acaromyces ingoldii]
MRGYSSNDASSEALKRREQNRLAQARQRHRKEVRVQELEAEVEEMRTILRAQEQEIRRLHRALRSNSHKSFETQIAKMQGVAFFREGQLVGVNLVPMTTGLHEDPSTSQSTFMRHRPHECNQMVYARPVDEAKRPEGFDVPATSFAVSPVQQPTHSTSFPSKSPKSPFSSAEGSVVPPLQDRLSTEGIPTARTSTASMPHPLPTASGQETLPPDFLREWLLMASDPAMMIRSA